MTISLFGGLCISFMQSFIRPNLSLSCEVASTTTVKDEHDINGDAGRTHIVRLPFSFVFYASASAIHPNPFRGIRAYTHELHTSAVFSSRSGIVSHVSAYFIPSSFWRCCCWCCLGWVQRRAEREKGGGVTLAKVGRVAHRISAAGTMQVQPQVH